MRWRMLEGLISNTVVCHVFFRSQKQTLVNVS
jgi:hypothetical protein